jgi:molybdopterin/thiamine biosynthesis adenylyltransferase
MQDNKLTRFKDATWLGNKEQCIIGGAGGISSWLTLMLARANFAPIVYDFDMLEEHNLGGQLFPVSGIGQAKVDVLADVVKQFCDSDISVLCEKYDLSSMTSWYVFSGFDNMKARNDMFTLWEQQVKDLPEADKHRCIFIDGRLLAEQIQIFCVVGNNQQDIDNYRTNFLFSDDEVADGPCTMKQTSHAAAIIAGLMTGFFTNHIHNVRTGSVTRAVPFSHEYFIPINLTD